MTAKLREPTVTVELLEYLSQVFPDRCPQPTDSDREVWMAVGAAKVVAKLRSIYQRQTNNLVE